VALSGQFEELLNLISLLREHNLYFELSDCREDAIEVQITVPGERWEVDFLSDGSVDVEIFKSDGHIHERAKLDSLFKKVEG
jgi:hypothetical protein